MATFAEVAGVPVPARSDGVSLLPKMRGEKGPAGSVYIEYFEGGRTPKFSQFEPAHRNRLRKQMQMIGIGKLIGVRYDITNQNDSFEIYDATEDPKEAQNLGGQDKYADMQQRFKDLALESRRPDAEAPRPYDNELVPADAGKNARDAQPGLRWQDYAGKFPWVPQFDRMFNKVSDVSAQPDLSGRSKDTDFGFYYSGFIEIPSDGKYTFTLTTNSVALVRFHEATVIDADFGHKAGTAASGSILLKSGKHQIRIYYANREATVPQMKLEWQSPEIDKQVVPASAFSH
jgi:hypothetical protein